MGAPSLVLILSVTFGSLTMILMIIALCPDTWERTEFDVDCLRSLHGVVQNETVYAESEGFYKVVIADPAVTNSNKSTYLLRNSYGGIWKLCDTISDAYRQSSVFQEALKEQTEYPAVPIFMADKCFNYITGFHSVEPHLVDDPLVKAASLFRMHNTAASCGIVGILCLATAIVTGALSIWQRQVSACMVTGVMYIVAGVFVLFSLIIMMTKVGYQQDDVCYTIDPMPQDMCACRTEAGGWSEPVGWLSFSFSIVTMGFWLYLARCFRIETAKSMM